MKKFYSLVALSVFILLNSSFALDYGPFTKKFVVGNSYVNVYFFVPDNYDETKEYPVVLGMSPGGGPGIGMRDMLTPIAIDQDFIVACPDVGGDILSRALAYCELHYNVDTSLVICTGYSAGGAAIFPFGVDNPELVKGVIGIAPSIGGITYENCTNRAFGLICGTADGTMGAVNMLYDGILKNGGNCLLFKKEGVTHIHPYFGSPEFQSDWTECFNFIKDFQPKEMQKLISPANKSYAPPEPIELTWEAFNDTEEYEIDIRFVTLPIMRDTIKGTSYIFEDFKPNSFYKWRVRPLTGDSTDSWSYLWQFQTKAKMIDQPVELIFPEDSAVDLSWVIALRFSNIAGSDIFHIQISDDEFNTIIKDDSTCLSTGTTEIIYHGYGILEQAKRYYWQVRAGNNEGWGPWSKIRTFTTSGYLSVENIAESDIKIYPNPVNDALYISCDFPYKDFKISLYDQLDRRLEVNSFHKDNDTNEYILNTSHLSSGIYYLAIEFDDLMLVRMFIKL